MEKGDYDRNTIDPSSDRWRVSPPIQSSRANRNNNDFDEEETRQAIRNSIYDLPLNHNSADSVSDGYDEDYYQQQIVIERRLRAAIAAEEQRSAGADQARFAYY